MEPILHLYFRNVREAINPVLPKKPWSETLSENWRKKKVGCFKLSREWRHHFFGVAVCDTTRRGEESVQFAPIINLCWIVKVNIWKWKLKKVNWLHQLSIFVELWKWKLILEMKFEECALFYIIINLCWQILMSEDLCNLFSSSICQMMVIAVLI